MTWKPPPARAGHPYYMHDAIYAQPGALRLVLRENRDSMGAIAAHLKAVERVVLSGIGTSWHACLVGELLLAGIGNLGHRVRAFHSFELKSYWPDPDSKTATIVVSHRGTKRFSLEALEQVKGAGGLAIALTGKGSGEGLKIADYRLVTVDQEASAAHTVSYTTALAILAALAAEVGARNDIMETLETIPDLMASLLGQESWEELASRFASRRCYYFVGGGPNTPTAYEAALKMNEANHTTTVGLNVEQILHGPWAAMEAEDLVVLIAPPGPAYERCLAVAKAAREVGAAVLGVVQEGDRKVSALCAQTVTLPPVPEPLTPLLAVIPLQLLTYHLALHRGRNPDTMRGDQPVHARARASFSL